MKDPGFFFPIVLVSFPTEKAAAVHPLFLTTCPLKRTPFSHLYDLRDVMAQKCGPLYFCSDPFIQNPSCSVISFNPLHYTSSLPFFVKNMLQASQKKRLTGSFQPVSGIRPFIVSLQLRYPDCRSFPILIVFPCPRFRPFHRRTLFLGRINFS